MGRCRLDRGISRDQPAEAVAGFGFLNGTVDGTAFLRKLSACLLHDLKKIVLRDARGNHPGVLLGGVELGGFSFGVRCF